MMARARRITEIGDAKFARALSHPLRVRILTALEDREASPSELAKEFGVPLPNVSYHFRQLMALGMLELKRTAARRGAVEHYYRATPSDFSAAWAKIPTLVRSGMVAQTIHQLGEEAMEAAAGNGFRGGDVTRTAAELDAHGWEEVKRILHRAHDEIDKAIAKGRERSDNGQATLPGTIATLVFAKPTAPVTPSRVMAVIREIIDGGGKATLASVTRHIFPAFRHQVGRQNPPGSHVHAAIEQLLAQGAIRQAGTYKRGPVYEPTE
jgi:DNA-binding transcriptional ArsR family regulator